ncbi:MAG: SpoIIE family protein phosphatase [Tissierellia bacterium]|nr:SpoIIE family protein phosphatase [Tissierellia bacterium]
MSYKKYFTELNKYDVLEGMADWVRVVDGEFNVVYANNTMRAALGEEIVGLPCYAAFEKSEKCNFCLAKRTIETGEVIQMEEQYRGRAYSVKSSPVRDDDGNIFAAVEVFRDVTRERKLEQVLIERNKNIRADIRFASTIQERLLPDKKAIKGINFDYVYQPSQVLSGDIFDIIIFDDNTVGMYMADVVGHGVSASMMTMFIYHTVRMASLYTSEPGELLKFVHKKFLDLNLETDKYFSLLYAKLDLKNHEFSFSNAGHNCAPLIWSNSSVEVLEQFGYPIMNLRDELKFDTKSVNLKQGDKVLLYTDGCVEIRDSSGQMLGVDGLVALYQEFGHMTLHNIFDKVLRFSWGEQKDDYAMLQVEIGETQND